MDSPEEQSPFKLSDVPMRPTTPPERAIHVPPREAAPQPQPAPDTFVSRRQPAEPVLQPAAKTTFRFARPKLQRKALLFIGIPALLLLGAVIWLGATYKTALNKQASANQQVKAAQTQVPDDQAIIAEISQYMTLPNETPAFATVTNLAALKGQDFFKNAQVGDKMIIYQKSHRGLLYRPSTHRVIEYGKVTFTGPNP